METVCKSDMCTGCGACINRCASNAISIQDNIENINAVIDLNKCIHCNACYSVCPVNNPPKFIKPSLVKQGWASDSIERMKSSSGGLSSSIAKCFIENDGIVYTCVFENGLFQYKRFNSLYQLGEIVGSKYVKSDVTKVYKDIQKDLIQKNKVLLIGLPCHIAGVKKYIGEFLNDRLYTIDLICHGSPSSKILERYLEENKLNLNEILSIKFRKKEQKQLFIDEQPLFKPRGQDEYTLAFFKNLDFTRNCYNCLYAKYERISDITLGDSWGSNLSKNEQKNGISLCLVQTKKGIELIDKVSLNLFDVDVNIACQNNEQLNRPSKIPKMRSKFFNLLNRGYSVKISVFLCYPKIVIKNYLSLCKSKFKSYVR